MSDGTRTPNDDEKRSSVWRWWRSLDEDRAGRSELRRCDGVGDIAFTAAYHRLLRRLGSRLGEGDARRVAAAAAVLAHVEREPSDGPSFARHMGAPRGGVDGAPVSDTRFRHLLRTDDVEDLMRGLIRVVRQLDRTAPVESLFRDLMRWDESTRMRWARDYYEAAPMAQSKKS